MFGRKRIVFSAVVLGAALAGASPASAQKSGGTLVVQHWDSPASMSIHEEATYSVVVPIMGVMNNLVLFRQDKEQNSMDNIVPDLAESWSWSEDGKELTFKLRQGVKWHDGKPFTAADVKCTLDLIQGKAKDRLRGNPRKEWYNNVAEVMTNGDYEAVFKLERPQPALLTLLASGYSPIYPCHVSPQQMRQHPIGTGPFKFVEFKPNEHIKVAKNPDYWKKGRPYLDAIEYKIVPNRSTAILGFVAGQYDMTWPIRGDPGADARRQGPEAERGVRGRPERHRQPAGQPREAAVRQSRIAQGAGPGDRPQSLYRYHDRRAGQDRRRRCCRRRRACGACPTRCCGPSPAMVPMSRRTVPRPARS